MHEPTPSITRGTELGNQGAGGEHHGHHNGDGQDREVNKEGGLTAVGGVSGLVREHVTHDERVQ